MIDRKSLQTSGLDILIENKGFQFSSAFFPYTSGKIGPYLVNVGVVQTGKHYGKVIGQISGLIRETLGIDRLSEMVISGGETKDWILSGPTAIELGTDHTMLYKDRKITGTDLMGRKVIHVADLNNEGSSPRDYWVPTIHRFGGMIKDIFFYIDRNEEGVEVMKRLGLKSDSVVNLDGTAWDYLQKKEVITSQLYKNIRERGTTKEERDEWAKKMLLSDEGIDRLIELFTTQSNKTVKVIREGYPNLRAEIKDRILTKYGRKTSHAINILIDYL
jgi:orotate phosphoribosyltransferase